MLSLRKERYMTFTHKYELFWGIKGRFLLEKLAYTAKIL